jgi:uncharacterized protein with HEPN domain
MLDASREAISIARGRTAEEAASDRVLALALVKLIEIIGEAASKVTREFQEAHSEIPWRQITGMRHVLVHDYDRIDFDRVWATIGVDLPALAGALEAVLPPRPDPT